MRKHNSRTKNTVRFRGPGLKYEELNCYFPSIFLKLVKLLKMFFSPMYQVSNYLDIDVNKTIIKTEVT